MLCLLRKRDSVNTLNPIVFGNYSSCLTVKESLIHCYLFQAFSYYPDY